MLKLNRVSKTFNRGTAVENTALSGLSLHVRAGEFVTVIGGNGSGKSTLMNAICGVFPIDSGSITIDGRDITNVPEHRRASVLGRVFQDPLKGSAPNMTIEENLALAMMRGKAKRLLPGIRRSQHALLRDTVATLGLGLEDRMAHKVGLLSGGQRQALTLLMATLRSPKVLLLDEHTAALDPKTARSVMHISRELIQRESITALMVTHNMKDAIEYGDRLIMMQGGEIIFESEGEAKRSLTVQEMVARFDLQDTAAIGAASSK